MEYVYILFYLMKGIPEIIASMPHNNTVLYDLTTYDLNKAMLITPPTKIQTQAFTSINKKMDRLNVMVNKENEKILDVKTPSNKSFIINGNKIKKQKTLPYYFKRIPLLHPEPQKTSDNTLCQTYKNEGEVVFVSQKNVENIALLHPNILELNKIHDKFQIKKDMKESESNITKSINSVLARCIPEFKARKNTNNAKNFTKIKNKEKGIFPKLKSPSSEKIVDTDEDESLYDLKAKIQLDVRHTDLKSTPTNMQDVTLESSCRNDVKKYYVDFFIKKLKETFDASPNSKQYRNLITKAALTLKDSQIRLIPCPYKNDIERRVERIAERIKLKGMSESEKQEYFKEKDEKRKLLGLERKKLLREQFKRSKEEADKKYDEADLNLPTLMPLPKPVSLPSHIPPDTIGDILIAVQFFNTFKSFLLTSKSLPDNIHCPLTKHLTYFDLLLDLIPPSFELYDKDKKLFKRLDYKNNFLTIFLLLLINIILNDELYEKYSAYHIPIHKVTINFGTMSELIRMCLEMEDNAITGSVSNPCHNSNYNQSPNKSIQDNSFPLNVSKPKDYKITLSSKLEHYEYENLNMHEKVHVLTSLCHLALTTHSLQAFIEQKYEIINELRKNVISYPLQKSMKDEKVQVNEIKTNTHEISDYTKIDTVSLDLGIVQPPQPSQSSVSPTTFGDLASLVKNRRALSVQEKLRQSAEGEIIKREKDRKRQEEVEAFKYQKLRNKLKEHERDIRSYLRWPCLGYDRNNNRYWFFKDNPYIFVEKYDQEAYNYDKEASLSPSNNQWYFYDSISEVEELINNLSPKGKKEYPLKLKLNGHEISRTFFKSGKNISPCYEILSDLRFDIHIPDIEKSNLQNQYRITMFKEELLNFENRLAQGGLGGVKELESFEFAVNIAVEIGVLGHFLIEIYATIYQKFIIPPLLPSSNISSSPTNKDNNDGKVETRTTIDTQNNMEKWKESVLNATTISRLWVLMELLDACIKWEKSAENAKCKVCRKKEDAQSVLIICDKCNNTYHLYCLKPPLKTVPDGDWFCNRCQPQVSLRDSSSRKDSLSRTDPASRSHEADSQSDASSTFEPHSSSLWVVGKPKDICKVCKKAIILYGETDDSINDLTKCSNCACSYHLLCHVPSLRYPPRTGWKCSKCTNTSVHHSNSKCYINKRLHKRLKSK